MGSVMVWNDNGTTRRTLILDMKYHNVTKHWGDYTDISGITNYDYRVFIGETGYILGSSNSNTSAYNAQTDAVLDAKFNWRDPNTSKQNTDLIIAQYPSGNYAANYCRSKTVNGIGCDLPNMQTLVRIFCDRATIHSLDSSDTSSRWVDWFDDYFAWVSSEYNYRNAWRVDCYGGVFGSLKDSSYRYVVPTLDL